MVYHLVWIARAGEIKLSHRSSIHSSADAVLLDCSRKPRHHIVPFLTTHRDLERDGAFGGRPFLQLQYPHWSGHRSRQTAAVLSQAQGALDESVRSVHFETPVSRELSRPG